MSDTCNPPLVWRQTRGRAATRCGQHCRHGAGWPGPAYGSLPAQHGTLDMPTGASKGKKTKSGSVLHSYMYSMYGKDRKWYQSLKFTCVSDVLFTPILQTVLKTRSFDVLKEVQSSRII